MTILLLPILALARLLLAIRRDLRGATLALAGIVFVGWFSTLPSVARPGLDFRGYGAITSLYVLVAPVMAFTAAVLAWTGARPGLAALLASAPTLAGLLSVIAFAVGVMVSGF